MYVIKLSVNNQGLYPHIIVHLQCMFTHKHTLLVTTQEKWKERVRKKEFVYMGKGREISRAYYVTRLLLWKCELTFNHLLGNRHRNKIAQVSIVIYAGSLWAMLLFLLDFLEAHWTELLLRLYIIGDEMLLEAIQRLWQTLHGRDVHLQKI